MGSVATPQKKTNEIKRRFELKSKNRTPVLKCTEVVQVALLPEYVKDIDSLLVEISEIKSAVLELAQEGYSVSVMYDPDESKYSVRLAGIYSTCENPTCLLYGNGETLDLAFLAIYIKHFLVSNRGKWVSTPKNTRGLS